MTAPRMEISEPEPAPTPFPSYAELRERTDAPAGSSWGVFGDGDQLGMLNNLTAAATRKAATLVRAGVTFNLDYPVNAFVPSLSGTRRTARHEIFANNENHRDDWLDSFFLQSTSQLDGLRHFRHPVHGFYGGVPDELIAPGSPVIGLQLASERAIVGRGVLLDLPAFYREAGVPFDVGSNHAVTPRDLDGAFERQGLRSETGDIVILYTGWARHFLGSDEPTRERQRGISPGLDQTEEVLSWLWDHRVALIASDNSSLEAYPVQQHSQFFVAGEAGPKHGADHRGLMHRNLLGLLGLLLGELWQLEELAAACRTDERYEFLLSVKPLNLIGAVGSPANAIAVK